MSSKPSVKPNLLAYALASAVSQQKKKNRTRAGGLQELVAPEPPDWWNGDAQFAGLVPKEDQEKDMLIKIGIWDEYAGAGDTDILQFQWKPSTVSDWRDAQPPIGLVGPLDPADFPIELSLSKDNFSVEGTFDLRYHVTIYNNTTTYSDVTTFIIDKTPPNANQSPDALTFVDSTIADSGITAEYLAANGGVEVVIPSYQDKQLGDSLELYVYNPDVVPTEPAFLIELDTSQQVKVPSSAFEALHDGYIYFYYRLVDKVRNRGPISDNAETGLFLKPVPVPPLAAPLVPRIDDDKVLNLDDLVLGTDLVEIKLYGNWLERDQIELTWGTSPNKVYYEVTTSQDPLVVNVSYASVMAPAYGAGPGQKPTPISYEVVRGHRRFGSDVTTIDVDFFVPGPVNPERPRPVNPLLPRVTVRGTGSNPTDNVLNADDAGKPVDVTVDLYDPIGPGEQMLLYWDALENQVGSYSPPLGNEGNSYTFKVAWDAIKDLPSKQDVAVYYTVGLASGEGNVESCVPTLVDVTAALPIILAEPEFPDAVELSDGSLMLNCDSFLGADQHVRVRFPGNSPVLKGGERVTIFWQCYTDRLGLIGVGPAIIKTRELTAAEANDGFEDIFTPFDQHILPVGRNGAVRLTYLVPAAPPMPLLKGELLIRASAVNAGGTCPINSSRVVGAYIRSI